MARKAEGFSLAALMGDVSKSDTSAPVIEMIDIDRIEPDPRNFYSLSNLEPLAAAIALDGIQQPLVVMQSPDDPDKVRILSGHRRRAAVQMLVDDGSDARAVPCIRRTYSSGALAELQLILANSTSRVLSSAELSRQAERVEELLYQLKSEGVSFPGRMRDQVAAACQVSASKLARLKVIRDGLSPQFADQYESGALSEQAAYALARMDTGLQERIAKVTAKKAICGYNAERLLSHADSYAACALSCPDGTPCSNLDRFLRHDLKAYAWDTCHGTRCCRECSGLASCDFACSATREERRRMADEKAQAKADAEAADAARRERGRGGAGLLRPSCRGHRARRTGLRGCPARRRLRVYGQSR